MNAPSRVALVTACTVILAWPSVVFGPTAIIHIPQLMPTPDPETVGLVWGGSDLYSCYQGVDGDNAVAFIAKRVGDDWVEWARFQGLAGPIAWDDVDSSIWVVDWTHNVIAEYVDDDGSGQREFSIQIPSHARRDSNTVSGLTWDGVSLLLVTDCGLCSTVFRIHPRNGHVLASFYPKCNPRGLAFRPGSHPTRGELWTVAYRGPNRDPILSKRVYSLSTVADLPVPQYLSFGAGAVPPNDPSALTIKGNRLWIVDRTVSRIREYEISETP